jgi:hypothetical protein
MKATVACTLDMLDRVLRFLLEQSLTSAVPRASAARDAIIAVVSTLRAAARDQTGGRAESAGGVDLRQKTWRQLRRVLAGVNRTARVLEEDFPGIRAQFRLPRTRSYPKLLAAARAIAAAAAPMQAAFIEAGHAPDFLDEIAALLAAFEAATAQKQGGKITQVASTAAMKEQARLGVRAATKLDAFARNHYRDQPEMLAAWRHARHTERSPRRSAAEAPASTKEPQAPAAPRHLNAEPPQNLPVDVEKHATPCPAPSTTAPNANAASASPKSPEGQSAGSH